MANRQRTMNPQVSVGTENCSNATKESCAESFDAKRERIHNYVTKLEVFLGLRLSDIDVKVWIEQLSQYPNWKLAKLNMYRLDERGGGRTLAHVCKYLDELRPAPERESFSMDLGYKQLEHKPRHEIAYRTLQHCKAMMGKSKTSEELDAIEREWVLGMRRDFPTILWTGGRKANRLL